MRQFISTLALLLCVGTAAHAQDSQALDAAFPRDVLSIATSSARDHHFEIWVATTPDQQERGLMFVTALPADHGMLFVEEPPRVMSMWMKNTLIPLDMLFIASDGRILYIKARATPQSLAVIGYEQRVRGVLELRGGEAAARGIHVGDFVKHSVFGSLPQRGK